MDAQKLFALLRILEVMDKELVCIQKMLDDFVPPFFGEIPEVETIVNQLWCAIASRPLLRKIHKNLLAELNQKLLGG